MLLYPQFFTLLMERLGDFPVFFFFFSFLQLPWSYFINLFVYQSCFRGLQVDVSNQHVYLYANTPA